MRRRVRPRPKARVVIDPHNAYARLGVSPLMATSEIKALILKKRADVQKCRRGQSRSSFDLNDAEMARLQAIEDEIGVAKKRAAYDAANPHNTLLTVQPPPGDRILGGSAHLDVVTSWLREVLGPHARLLSPASIPHWSPPDDEWLRAQLERHRREPAQVPHESDELKHELEPALSVENLGRSQPRRPHNG